MRTITKATLQEQLRAANIVAGKHVSDTKEKELIATFFKVLRSYITDGYHIRIKKIGWIGGNFKKGGRPVRNPKTGETKSMPDTYCIKLRPRIRPQANRINTSDVFTLMALSGIDEDTAKVIYLALVGAITEVVEKGSRIEIRGFGTFFKKELQERTGRNPKTGEAVTVGAKCMAYYKVSKSMIKEANEKLGAE